MSYPFEIVVVPGGVVGTVSGETVVRVVFVPFVARRGWERRVDTNGNMKNKFIFQFIYTYFILYILDV